MSSYSEFCRIFCCGQEFWPQQNILVTRRSLSGKLFKRCLCHRFAVLAIERSRRRLTDVGRRWRSFHCHCGSDQFLLAVRLIVSHELWTIGQPCPPPPIFFLPCRLVFPRSRVGTNRDNTWIPQVFTYSWRRSVWSFGGGGGADRGRGLEEEANERRSPCYALALISTHSHSEYVIAVPYSAEPAPLQQCPVINTENSSAAAADSAVAWVWVPLSVYRSCSPAQSHQHYSLGASMAQNRRCSWCSEPSSRFEWLLFYQFPFQKTTIACTGAHSNFTFETTTYYVESDQHVNFAQFIWTQCSEIPIRKSSESSTVSRSLHWRFALILLCYFLFWR